MERPSQRVFITGASSGIGAATARLLAEQGHQVFATARRQKALDDLHASLTESARSRMVVRSMDVLDVEAHRSAVQECLQAFGGLDVVVPNAGLGRFENMATASLEDWHTMVDVNIKGVLNTTHLCLPALIESRGLIVNIGSVASRNVFPNSGVYCATKHAVLALGEAVRQDLKSSVATTTVCPGAVDTAFIEQTRDTALLDQYRPNFKQGMRPEFIAEHILMAIECRGRGIVSDITLRPDFL